MTDASIGYLSQFWLEQITPSPSSPPLLVKLSEVVRIGLPNDANFEQIEGTHLESPDRRREFVRGFRVDQDYEVELNYVPGSQTDQLIRAVAGADGTYAARIVEYDGYTEVATHDFDLRSVSFTLADIETETIKRATMTYKVASQVVSTYPS